MNFSDELFFSGRGHIDLILFDTVYTINVRMQLYLKKNPVDYFLYTSNGTAGELFITSVISIHLDK